MKNYYEILELDSSASFKEIKSSYRRLSKKYHPDLNPDNQEFEEYYKDIQEAYHHLKDGIKREEFDAKLRASGVNKSRFGIFERVIKDRFKANRHDVDWEDPEDSELVFRPVFKSASSKKKRTQGIILIIFSVIVISGIFLVESRIDNLSYKGEMAVYNSETPSLIEAEPASEPKPKIKDESGQKSVGGPESQQELVSEVQNVIPRNEVSYRSDHLARNSNPSKETIPVTIFSVNNVVEDSGDKSSKSLEIVPQTVEATNTPIQQPAAASIETRNIPVAINNSGNSSSSANSSSTEINRVYTTVDKKPTFSGGASAFVQYLNTSIQYPPAARESGINGRVLVTFVVERDGKITNISVLQGIGGGCDEEAVRVMKNAPAWIPGENNGERVRVQCTIPITFKLH